MVAIREAAALTLFSFPRTHGTYIAAGVLILLALFPRFERQTIFLLEGALARFSRRTVVVMFSLFSFVIGARLLALSRLPVPVSGVHDSFSYLLLADTLAHGRLTNPPHPMWVSFETFHVNWLPTYASMYPPAQGVVLALGEILGHPWIGVLLSDAAMCGLIFWALWAWMPTRWAFLGAALVAVKFGIASYWMNSYWGGAVAAIGGALVLGAVARVIKRSRPRDAVLLGLGLAILANSRPYEGLVFAIPAGLWLLIWLIRRPGTSGDERPASQRRVLAPLLVVLAITAASMAYYNWRVTGNALVMPHMLNMSTYHTAAVFLWQHPKPEKKYRNKQFDDFYNDWERDAYEPTLDAMIRVTKEKRNNIRVTFLWPGLLLALPGLPFVLRDRKFRFLLATLVVTSIGLIVVVWSQPHYAAPLTCAIYALIVQSIRHLRTMRVRKLFVGRALSRAIAVILMMNIFQLVRTGACDPKPDTCEGDTSRFATAEKLAHKPGKHLVMVRYDADHNVHDEWVYNSADIDAAKVVWARELDARQNRNLFAYFHDRQVWLVTPDDDNTYLEPYTAPGVPLLDSQ